MRKQRILLISVMFFLLGFVSMLTFAQETLAANQPKTLKVGVVAWLGFPSGHGALAPETSLSMQVLVLAAPRNGVGRTTLAHSLARLALRNDAGPVVLLDADPRGDLSQMCAEQPRRRLEAR